MEDQVQVSIEAMFDLFFDILVFPLLTFKWHSQVP